MCVHVGVCSCGPGRKNPGGARKDPGGDGGMVAALAQIKQEAVLLQLSCLRPSNEVRQMFNCVFSEDNTKENDSDRM